MDESASSRFPYNSPTPFSSPYLAFPTRTISFRTIPTVGNSKFSGGAIVWESGVGSNCPGRICLGEKLFEWELSEKE